MAEQSLQIKRNKNLFNTKDEAVQHLTNIASTLVDGEIVLCRYLKDDKVETLVGFGTNKDDKMEISYINSLDEIDMGEISWDLGNGLTTTDGKISVKIAPNSESKNFLLLDANNSLAVNSIDTDATVLQQDIKVAGLNETKLGAGVYQDGMTISAGTNVYTILQNILCQELYPTAVKSTQGSCTSSIAKPTINLSKSGNIVYGSEITLDSVTCGALSVATTASTVTGLTYGYSANDDDKADSTATTISKQVSSAITNSAYDLNVSFTSGFESHANVTATSTSHNDCKITGITLTVGMGTNTVSALATGPVVKGSADAIASGYTVSNLGNTDSKKTYSAVDALSRELSRPTNSQTASVNGVLPCYWNISNSTLVSTTSQCSLINGKQFTDIEMPSEVESKQHFYFDFPADRTISSFKMKDLSQNYIDVNSSSYTTDTEVDKTINGIVMKYKRLQIVGDLQGKMTLQINLSKNLSEADFTKLLKNNN